MVKNEKFDELFDKLVPATGQCETVRGELIRAVARIGYRFYNDGDMLGAGYGNETCNAAGRYLGTFGNHKMLHIITKMWDGSIKPEEQAMPEEEYESLLEHLVNAAVEYCTCNDPSLDEETIDMHSLYRKEDAEYEEEEEWDEEEEGEW